MTFRTLAIASIFSASITANAQTDTVDYSKQRDIIDVAENILGKKIMKRDTLKKKTGRIHISGSPSVGYSLSSGLAGIVVANGAFYTSEDKVAKLSNVYVDAVYTQLKQTIVHLQSNLWTKGNKFNIVNDWRYYSYPQKTYGLGGNTSLNKFANQSFNYLRLYQTVLKRLRPNLYAGIGYALDYHWQISGTSPNSFDGDSVVISNIDAYGISGSSMSSGVLLNLLFDNRLNSINPAGGTYANFTLRDNLPALGSNSHWQSLLLDLRHYVPFPRKSQNILAFWSYNSITLNGNPPYLDLPSTGWDTYSNTGRGYIQGRFRSKNMLYLEAEYRFLISKNGLFGGVVFANAQSFSDWPSNAFNHIAPAAGFGLRTKFNKYSRTNIAMDYGFGMGGSQGIFVNLGEVF
ncbi:MAG: BamA/TamA family outer membrane protein [Bacteroidetes bacterium]|nr:BamA/TamA family outer membrane protein [Bacteroidota bacterium]